MTMYKRNTGANNNQLLTIYQGVHITHFKITTKSVHEDSSNTHTKEDTHSMLLNANYI